MNPTHRRKPKKRPNRYNPNAPDYKAVHAPWSKPGAFLALPVDLVALAMASMAKRA